MATIASTGQQVSADLVAVEVISFGYGHKDASAKPLAPPAAHLTFDVRGHFKDPHVDPGLRHLTAADQRVTQAVMNTSGVPELISGILAAIHAYRQAPSPAPVTVAVGCVGGRHRSAVIAAEITRELRAAGVPATLTHRDITREVIQREGGQGNG
jgi:RNase adaptor protein for sRNA GlmZ degradation